MALTDQIIGVESGGDPNARNPNSSAMGAGQFINSTWLDMVGRYRPDLVQGKSPEEILALRSDPQLSREMTEAYAAQNGKILTQSGHEATPGNTYLAHFAGPKGAVSVLSADPNTPVSAILTPEAVKANPFLARMTAADLRVWADKKMGGAAPVQQPAQATPAAAPMAPLQMAPQQLPIFPQAAPQQQAQPQQAEQSALDQMQPPQAAPIVFPKQRQVDLSKLRAALQRPPIFSRG